mgnify:CR=1 FL=1
MLTLDDAYVRAALPRRDPEGHKGNFGKVYVLGGSVANAFSGHISHPGVYVLAGVNAPMLLAMVPMLESAMDTQELIKQGIQAAREGCVFINGLMKQAFEESEEDFV